nr:YggS family pyridoxal phosphate-dependent enzyme [Pararhodospirillum photometricum]
MLRSSYSQGVSLVSSPASSLKDAMTDPSLSSPFDVPAALAAARATLAHTCADAGRNPADVTLVAVSKTHPAEAILPALTAGQRVFGENRVQEAQGKWPALREQFPDITLRLIGPLQTNKVREAVALFDAIDSVDRPKLAQALAEEMARQNKKIPVLIQVNTGEEPQKAGVFPREADAFVRQCREDWGLDVQGLMGIPPVDEEPAPHFALLREIARRHALPILSMGMSADYPTALTFGATHIRLGSALFGSRTP